MRGSHRFLGHDPDRDRPRCSSSAAYAGRARVDPTRRGVHGPRRSAHARSSRARFDDATIAAHLDVARGQLEDAGGSSTGPPDAARATRAARTDQRRRSPRAARERRV